MQVFQLPDSNYVDTIHHFISTKELTFGSWMKGFSGSPVFLQEKKSKKWRFCGILIGGCTGILVQGSNSKPDKLLPGGLILLVRILYFRHLIQGFKNNSIHTSQPN